MQTIYKLIWLSKLIKMMCDILKGSISSKVIENSQLMDYMVSLHFIDFISMDHYTALHFGCS
jgi:hypothetical protein